MKKIAWLLFVIYIHQATALTVIQIDGPVANIQPYLSRFQLNPKDFTGEEIMLSNLTPKVFSPSLPVNPAPLKLGRVKRQLVRYPQLVQPIFLIGRDKKSLHWLEKNKLRLQQIQAIGFLIEANTPEEWQSIQTSVPQIPIIPANGRIFTKRFQIETYPVLISQDMIEQ